MKRVQEQEKNHGREKHTLSLVIGILIIVVSVSVFLFLRFYNSYIDGVLYHERLNQMQEVTSQLFNGLEDVVKNQWENVESMSNYVELGKPRDIESLLTFMKKQAALNSMKESGSNLVAVDELGRYLTEEGWQGTLEEMNLLLDEPERLSFVSKSLVSGDTDMYFLKRLPEPVILTDGERSVKLIYYGIARDMEQLDEYFACEAYDNSNSVYVLNRQGMRLFQSNSRNLLEGYNAYKVLESMEYLHGHSFEEARHELETTGRGYANAVLDGEEYYYALYQMDSAAWTLLFLVPSAYVAADVVSMVNTTVRMILIFALLMLAVSTLIIFILLRSHQRQILDAERQNSEKLELAMQQAQAANRAKSDFLANMSHDIRTPMNAIVGITKLMEHEKNDPAKLDSYIHKVQSSSQHLLSLINDVLDMSKIESSEVKLNHEPVSLAEQIGQVDSIIRPQIEEHGQSFSIRVHEITHEYLIGDAVRLRQIFINLLSNAVKYTPYGGTVTLDMWELPGEDTEHVRLRIAVTDTGYGMTPEFATHIFEAFTRAENSMTNKVQGTGLGMAITKNIVDLMGGTITVQSEPDKGSCFQVTLPLLIDKTIHPIDAGSVLLLTDEEALRKNAEASFRESGLSFCTAKDQAEAEAVLRDHTVDTILLSGFLQNPQLPDLVQLLRKRAKNAVLVFCVDYTQQDRVSDILEQSGINGLIIRPFFLSNFARVVNEARQEEVTNHEEEGAVLAGRRFLCAEDNALNAEVLEAILDMNEASCVIYSDGQKLAEAFEKVKPGEYDAILMDVQMPVMNGLDATRAIRRSKNPLGRTIPIIAMTANAFSSDVQDCLDAGMDAHVAKPIDIGALERTLRVLQNRMLSGGGTTVRL